MKIVHMPSGLFPHFDSGFERRPLHPQCTDAVDIGCRLQGVSEHVEVVLQWKVDGKAMPDIHSLNRRSNDNDQWYYSFHLPALMRMAAVEYSFIAREDGQVFVSRPYQFEVLRELELDEPIGTAAIDNCIYAVYEAEQKQYELKIEISDNISIFFSSHLTGKAIDFTAFSEKTYTIGQSYMLHLRKPFALSILREGVVVCEYCPEFRLLIDSKGEIYRVTQNIGMQASAFYGFGEKFDQVNQRNKTPLSYVVEQYSNQQDKSYIPIPFFFTDRSVGFFQAGTWKTRFSLVEINGSDWNNVKLHSECPRKGLLFEGILFMGTPKEIIESYLARSGNPVLPPKWAFGPWMSSNGWNTQAEALEQIKYMNELAIPATVMVLEAWSDEETFYIWNDARYTSRSDGGAFTYEDFTFSEDGKWPNPKEFINTLTRNNLKLILWQIPVIKYEAAKHGVQLDLDTEYAIEHKLCIQNADGSPYRVTEMWFSQSLMPDFTNPDTVKWWFDKRKYLVNELGVAGFKTDGGEFLFDATSFLHDGRTVEEAHNDYPNVYIGAYHDFMNEELGKAKGITFSRAGYTGAQKYPIHWAGDQISAFSELRAQLTAGLSLGLSGVPFWGFDIGGFAGDFPSTELYLRSAAFAAFAPVMQFHSEPRYGQYYMTERKHWNNDRSPWNMAAANQDEKIIKVYRLFANLRMNLLPYLWREARHCADTGRPMMAHLIYDYSDDHNVIELDDEYMLGRDMLVAPIIEEGAAGRQIYLPAGNWYDFWTSRKITGASTVYYECDLKHIPVFVREGSLLPLHLNKALVMGSTDTAAAVSNNIDQYDNLGILLYTVDEASYEDETGVRICITRNDRQYAIEYEAPSPITFVSVADDRGSVFIKDDLVASNKVAVRMFEKVYEGYQFL